MSEKIKRAHGTHGKHRKKMNAAFLLTLPVFLWLFFASCDVKNTAPEPAESFSKIYDKADKSNYTAVDIKQTGDGGYIILGIMDNHPYLLKVNGNGDFLWDTADEKNLKNYSNPTADLLIFNQEYYFFCNKVEMGVLKDLVLLKISETNDLPVEEDLKSMDDNDIFRNIHRIRPLHASKPFGNSILLLAFNELDYLIFVKRKRDGNIEIGKKINIDYRCVYSVSVTDKRFHLSGVAGTQANENYYYFQSYSNDRNSMLSNPPCFTITKVRASDGKVIDEVAQENPFIAMDWDQIHSYRARIDNNIVSFSVSPEIVGIEKEEVHTQSELIPSKSVYVKTMRVNNEKLVFFAGSSKNNRIVLYAYAYDTSKGSLEERYHPDKKYFGHTHIYEAAGLIKTTNSGLAILGTTYVAGRLGRICLFKLSSDELKNFVFPENIQN